MTSPRPALDVAAQIASAPEQKRNISTSCLTFQGGTGDEDLDAFIKAGIAFADAAHDQWIKATEFKFQSEKEKSLASHAALPFLKKYVVHLSQFKNNKWWDEWQTNIVKKILVFAVENEIGAAAKKYADAVGQLYKDNKKPSAQEIQQVNQQANLLDFLLQRHNDFLTTSPYCMLLLSPDYLEEKKQRIAKNREGIKSFVTEDPVPFSFTHAYEHREKRAASLLFALLNGIELFRKKWDGHGYYPLLRAPLLVNVAVILTSVEAEIAKHLQASWLTKLAISMKKSDSLKVLTKLNEDLKKELAKIADVLLWHEEIFQHPNYEIGSPDLVLDMFAWMHDLLNHFSQDDSFNCVTKYWVHCDNDIRSLWQFAAEAEDKSKNVTRESPYWRYFEKLPADVTPEGLSHFRREFVVKYGNPAAKTAMEKMVFKGSDDAPAADIARALRSRVDLREDIKKKIRKYFYAFLQFKVLSMDCLLNAEKPLSEIEILGPHGFTWLANEKGAFAVFKKYFPEITEKSEILAKIAKEIAVLHALLLNPLEGKNWTAFLRLVKTGKNPELESLAKTLNRLVQPAVAKEAALDARLAMKSSDRFRELIKEHLKEEKFSPSDVVQFVQAKKVNLEKEFKARPDLELFYNIFHQPNNEEAWKALFVPEKFKTRESGAMLTFLQKLMYFVEKVEVFDACRELYGQCRHAYDTAIRTEHLVAAGEMYAREHGIVLDEEGIKKCYEGVMYRSRNS